MIEKYVTLYWEAHNNWEGCYSNFRRQAQWELKIKLKLNKGIGKGNSFHLKELE